MGNIPTKYYEVVQGLNVVGRFILKENAEKYVEQFNTKVVVRDLSIREQCFLDNHIEEEEREGNSPNNWLDDHDTTSEYGGV